MNDGRLPIYVVGEDEVHRALAMALVTAVSDQVARERGADWFDLDAVARWSALAESDGDAERSRWSDIHRPVPERYRRRLMGHLNGKPVGPGAQKIRGKLVECARAERPAALVVLFHDTDGDERLPAAAAEVLAWAAAEPAFPVAVVAHPHRDAEAWLLAAPLDEAQAERLAVARKTLGFDPSREPERLTASPNDAPTDAKRVARFVLLEEGEELARGRPASRSPAAADADRLAELLVSDLSRMASFRACGLADVVERLRLAIPKLLTLHLPVTGPGGQL